MKRFLAIALVATLGLFAGNAMAGTWERAAGVYSPGDAANGIGMSRHNLGAFGEHVTARDFAAMKATTEICVFCHTPHHAAAAKGTIWNRNAAASVYAAYGATIGGVIAGGAGALAAGSTSIACLSCHDGATAFDAIINAPGPGNVNNSVDTTTGRGWTFSEYTKNLGTSTRLDIYGADGSDSGGASNSLANDHPINIAYRGGTGVALVGSLRAQSTVIATINLAADLMMTTAYFSDIASNLWAVKGFLNSAATIGDLLRSDGINQGPGNMVECASCHDPHFKNQSAEEITDLGIGTGAWADTDEARIEQDGLFLRRVGGNTGSGVCRTCHEK